MRVPDATLDELRVRGYSLMEGFLSADELAAAQEALWLHFPPPEDYFVDPGAHGHYATSQFAGVLEFPYRSWDLNGLAVHPDLIDAVERYLQTTELHLYKVELWGKYAGAVNYEQPLHRDYGSHSLVVPRPETRYQQITTFIYLSDVTEEDGPTVIVPYDDGRDVPFSPLYLPFGSLADQEVRCVGAAGSLLMYRTDILHRGSDFTAPDRARFSLLRLPGPRHDVGRQDGVAEAVARTLGQVHPAMQRSPARPLRLAPAGRSLLGPVHARRRGGEVSRHKPRAVSGGADQPMTVHPGWHARRRLGPPHHDRGRSSSTSTPPGRRGEVNDPET